MYWWDDNRGVRLPAAARLLYWDGETFQPVAERRLVFDAHWKTHTDNFVEGYRIPGIQPGF